MRSARPVNLLFIVPTPLHHLFVSHAQRKNMFLRLAMCFSTYTSRFSCTKNFEKKISFQKKFLFKTLFFCEKLWSPYCRCAKWYLFLCAVNPFHSTANALLLHHLSGRSGFILFRWSALTNTFLGGSSCMVKNEGKGRKMTGFQRHQKIVVLMDILKPSQTSMAE